jgi:AcrR family transcriptional regulator
MPRPARERLILDVAGQVFARAGYHGASMDEIAALADVSKPMLYTYFGSKEGLYVAYIDRTGRELLTRLVGASESHQHPSARLRSSVTEFLAFAEEHRDGWLVLFGEPTSSRPLADEVARLRNQIAEWVRATLEESSTTDLTPTAATVDAIAHAIVGAGEALANWWLEHPDVDREQITEWYVRLIEAAAVAAP